MDTPSLIEKATSGLARKFDKILWRKAVVPVWSSLKQQLKTASREIQTHFINSNAGVVTSHFQYIGLTSEVKWISDNEFIADVNGKDILHSRSIRWSDINLVKKSVEAGLKESAEIRIFNEKTGAEKVIFEKVGDSKEIEFSLGELLSPINIFLRQTSNASDFRVELIHTHPFETLIIADPNGREAVLTAPLSAADISVADRLRSKFPGLNIKITAIIGLKEAFLSKVTYPAN
jgi:hypothetical protein